MRAFRSLCFNFVQHEDKGFPFCPYSDTLFFNIFQQKLHNMAHSMLSQDLKMNDINYTSRQQQQLHQLCCSNKHLLRLATVQQLIVTVHLLIVLAVAHCYVRPLIVPPSHLLAIQIIVATVHQIVLQLATSDHCCSCSAKAHFSRISAAAAATGGNGPFLTQVQLLQSLNLSLSENRLFLVCQCGAAVRHTPAHPVDASAGWFCAWHMAHCGRLNRKRVLLFGRPVDTRHLSFSCTQKAWREI
ncbi:hypothetical protein CEXT_239771 [Caerostris extrusa]|uniref:Uncharacterized protein n=1 Tax=Caerostris extrusa TaxID=172846 RepID=A0AAV4S4M1_CAEEX|nr:hypothetical protein CEXT_239771 [Caerostris extrusa]